MTGSHDATEYYGDPAGRLTWLYRAPAMIGPILKQSDPPAAISVGLTDQRRWP
jgi:hypothetical protein